MEGLDETLRRVAVSTFEDLCYMYPAPELERVKNGDLKIMVRVDFAGTLEGELVLKVTRELFFSIAANMLGQEHSTRHQRRDALGEVANVICGNLLRRIGGAGGAFRISTPRTDESGEQDKNGEVPPSAEIDLTMDQGKLKLILFTGKQKR